MGQSSPYAVAAHEKVRLSDRDTKGDPGKLTEANSALVLVKHREHLAHFQDLLYASQSHAVLIVLQGMDTAGKDGTISHLFSGVNPQGCDVTSFKVPTPIEKRHDFLWRVHKAVPACGQIGIFNRSHYEDVLSPRVHGLISKKTAHQRMDEINRFEESLAENNVVILKFFLHISHAEQTSRLQARLDDPHKHWKLSEADFKERLFWKQYQKAYEDILSHTSRKPAPWFVIPADHKWMRNLVISQILVDAIKGLKLKYPAPTMDASKVKL